MKKEIEIKKIMLLTSHNKPFQTGGYPEASILKLWVGAEYKSSQIFDTLVEDQEIHNKFYEVLNQYKHWRLCDTSEIPDGYVGLMVDNRQGNSIMDRVNDIKRNYKVSPVLRKRVHMVAAVALFIVVNIIYSIYTLASSSEAEIASSDSNVPELNNAIPSRNQIIGTKPMSSAEKAEKLLQIKDSIYFSQMNKDNN